MTDIERYAHVGIEKLAQELYEAQSLTPQAYPFTDWCNLPEQGKEGYIAQARRLLELYHIIPKLDGEPE